MEAHNLEIPDATVFLMDFPCGESFDILREETPWNQRIMTLYGKRVRQPRLTAWYGDPDCAYRYSGLRNIPLEWTPHMALLRDRLIDTLGFPFNSCLLNLYRDGQDSIAPHSDNEPELGPQPVIASLSLGSERTLVFRHRERLHADVSIALKDQEVLIMMEDTQKNWLHSVPKCKSAGERMNLTFRRIVS